VAGNRGRTYISSHASLPFICTLSIAHEASDIIVLDVPNLLSINSIYKLIFVNTYIINNKYLKKIKVKRSLNAKNRNKGRRCKVLDMATNA
jgi:hypothetical protein